MNQKWNGISHLEKFLYEKEICLIMRPKLGHVLPEKMSLIQYLRFLNGMKMPKPKGSKIEYAPEAVPLIDKYNAELEATRIATRAAYTVFNQSIETNAGHWRLINRNIFMAGWYCEVYGRAEAPPIIANASQQFGAASLFHGELELPDQFRFLTYAIGLPFPIIAQKKLFFLSFDQAMWLNPSVQSQPCKPIIARRHQPMN